MTSFVPGIAKGTVKENSAVKILSLLEFRVKCVLRVGQTISKMEGH